MVLLPARENISYTKEVRERANSPGPWSIYLFSRLEHPVIRSQIEELIFLAGRGKYSKERIARGYDERLAKIRSFTPVSFTTRRSRTSEGLFGPEEIISLQATRRDTGTKYTCKELHITESHEKGHVMRFEYEEEWTPGLLGMRTGYVLAGLFGKAFDFSGVEFSEEEYQRYRSRNPASAKKSKAEIRKIWIVYLASPHDLAERMSQLKNYFGFCGEEVFTKEHLWYAREHYARDTDYDNAMSPFFAAIPPEKEEAFLELMNSAGI